MVWKQSISIYLGIVAKVFPKFLQKIAVVFFAVKKIIAVVASVLNAVEGIGLKRQIEIGHASRYSIF